MYVILLIFLLLLHFFSLFMFIRSLIQYYENRIIRELSRGRITVYTKEKRRK